MRTLLVLASIAAAVAPAEAAPKKRPPPKDDKTTEQKEADRHFKSGVALFKEQKYSEALAEFERAYEIAPHPLVLYNIAGCHRELSHYAEAVKAYNRFLDEGKGKVPAARITAAKAELEGILARIARVTVAITPDGAELTVDGLTLGTMPIEMPLILPPGEHRFIAKAAGRKDAERMLRLASGDEVDVELKLAERPPEPVKPPEVVVMREPVVAAAPRTFAVGAGFGTNLSRVSDTGAPSLGFGVAIGSRLELGVDGTLVAYSVMPSIRVRLAGDAVSVHLIGAVPVSFTDGDMKQTFVAGAGGLGLRFRATSAIAFRLESLASYAGKSHGTTFPTFIGGELWF
ncbi:MAG TPA: tetratricopeptide repeat protein [Kofleriaceae bacterium]|jgi:hypothetical protein|nr:tetratricopeptide repeat protein [Kofleriaceae bacterium]